MGDRGAFLNIEKGEWEFKEGGITYRSVGEVDGVKVLVRDKGAYKAPDFSHTANRIYAVIQDGLLKHLAFYGEDHTQIKCIDYLHEHEKQQPHAHPNGDHKAPLVPITSEETALANKIRRRFNVK